MKKIFLLMAVATAMLIVSCNMFSPYGKKVKINDTLEIYIKGDSTTEADAKKLGTYFAETWKENKNNKSLQLSKDKNIYTIRMVVNGDKLKADSTLDGSFQLIRMLIQEEVFKGSKVTLILTDDKFKDIKTFDENYGASVENKTDSTSTK